MCGKLVEKGWTDGLAEKIGKRYLFDRLSEKAVHRVDRTAEKPGAACDGGAGSNGWKKREPIFVGLNAYTIQFLGAYKYGEELMVKLEKAMQ